MPNIHHQLIIESTPEKVYDAVTTEEGLSAWWTPNTKAKAELNCILRFPFGDDYFKEMKLVELKPLELVKWNCLTGDPEWVGTNVSFKLVSGNKNSLLSLHPEMRGQTEQVQLMNHGVTLLIFHQNDWAEYSPMFAECNYTWAQFLRSLKLFCETGKGNPWPNQHQK
jgi:uncharacterized protein YndB with AHSA1/START domain